MLSTFCLSAYRLSAQVIPNETDSNDFLWNSAASKAAFPAGSVTHVPVEFLGCEIELALVCRFKNSLLYFHHCFDDLGKDSIRALNDCRYETNVFLKIHSLSNSFARNSSDQAAAHLACTAAMQSSSIQGWLHTLWEMTRRGIRRMQQVSIKLQKL